MCKPHWKHDCDSCVYLGTVFKRDNGKQDPIDCYWCKNRSGSPSLDNVLGRYGSEGSEYMSSHPAECFAGPEEYLSKADRWYLYAVFKATLRGLYKPSPADD